MEKQIGENEDQMQALENVHRPEHYADQNSKSEMYDGMLLQYVGQPMHSQSYYKIMEEQEKDLKNQEKAQREEEQRVAKEKALN
jgi:hypothetical protein